MSWAFIRAEAEPKGPKMRAKTKSGLGVTEDVGDCSVPNTSRKQMRFVDIQWIRM